MLKYAALLIAMIATVSTACAQFVDDFDGTTLVKDKRGVNGWTWYTGDGDATASFSMSGKGYASVSVDATKDKRGIWWAIIKRCVSQNMDLSLLAKPNYELRIEARIKVSDAPKRVNLSLNTNRTTDFHSNLMEFDIGDTTDWHTISMTTDHFDAAPGDTVYGQLALMDWGLGKYRVDVDYFRVDIVDVDTTGPDKGMQVPYHPRVPEVTTFTYRVPVLEDGMIDRLYPDMSCGNWSTVSGGDTTRLLSVNGEQYVILRWNLTEYAGRKVSGSGLLELTTYSLFRSPDYRKDFGMIRVCEVMGGDPVWHGKSATYNSFTRGEPLDRVVNSQMIIDVPVNPLRGGKNLITISRPVLQRMIDGKTLGIAIKPLGAVDASFYGENKLNGGVGAAIYMNLAPSPSSQGGIK